MENELIDGVRGFAATELEPAAAAVDRECAFPSDRWQKLGAFGLAGLVIPEEHGGINADPETLLAIFGLVGGACASTAWALLSHSCVARGIAALGTPAQQARYLPKLARAELVGGALAGTEAGGGTNGMSMRSFARADGDHFILSGGKFFISQAGAADVYLALVRTSDAMGPEGFSCFIVEKGDAGVAFGRREDTMGLHGIRAAEILFQDARLPGDRLLGKVGGGFAVLGQLGLITGLGVAATAIGIADAAIDKARAHLRERQILGAALATVPGVRANMARLVFDIEGARARLHHGLSWLRSGAKGPPIPVWMAKIAATDVAASVVARALRMHGAIGYAESLPLERMLRDVQAFAIHWGNNDSLFDMIGKSALS